MLLPILAWAIDSRLMGAALLALNLGVALILALTAPVISAGLVPAARDEATFTSLSPVDGVWASPLIALWRLRWLIAAALALTPTLMIGVLHVNVAAFSAYHDSVIALGSAAPQEQVRLLLPGGAVPYFRLVLRAISAGLLPWAILPLAGMLGVTGVLLLDDVTLGQIAGLILTLIALLIGGITWNWLSLTPMFAQGLEIARTILVTGLLAGPTGLSAWIARQNTRWLLK